ncbi:hypothetical protein EJ065_3946 [Corallococcus coralloides]|uniref:Uncharacterized protein n=1 Tax=Corallococcus coralloides TaxID=184914 RepID=A0A410RUF4_CORCK|nr:hypothetical protein [Corallococcus coralloides]QAT85506.1 hypothetical protein EJ065_3946 [Corallococcus coralloides]
MSARKFQKASIEELVQWYAEGSVVYVGSVAVRCPFEHLHEGDPLTG